MSGLTDLFAAALLDHAFGLVATPAPATWYAGASTTDPGADGSGVTEPVGGSYARVAVTNNATNFPAAVGRTKRNGTVITFPAPTGSWGVVGWIPFYSASSGGTPKAWGRLASAVNVVSGGDAPFIPVAALVIDLPAVAD